MIKKKNSFIILTTGVNVIKPFFYIAVAPDKQIKVFVPGKLFHSSLMFTAKARKLPSELTPIRNFIGSGLRRFERFAR